MDSSWFDAPGRLSALTISLSSEEALFPLLLCLSEWKGDGFVPDSPLDRLGLCREVESAHVMRLVRSAGDKNLEWNPLDDLDALSRLVIPFLSHPSQATLTSGPTGKKTKVIVQLRPNHLKFTKTGPRGGTALHEVNLGAGDSRKTTTSAAPPAKGSGRGLRSPTTAAACLQMLEEIDSSSDSETLRLRSLGTRVAEGEAHQALQRIAVALCNPKRLDACTRSANGADLISGAAYLALPAALSSPIIERSITIVSALKPKSAERIFERTLSLAFSTLLLQDRLDATVVVNLQEAVKAAFLKRPKAAPLPEPSDSTRDFYPGWNDYWKWRGTPAAYDVEWVAYAETLLAINARKPKKVAQILAGLHYGYDEASSTWPDADWIALIRRAGDLGLDMGDAPLGWHPRIWQFATRSGYEEETPFLDPRSQPFVVDLLGSALRTHLIGAGSRQKEAHVGR